MTITYAHAISNPFLPASEETTKPFELRTVEASVTAILEDGEWNINLTINGEEMPTGFSSDKDRALRDAIANAEHTMMDRSRQPWL